jgi:D-alanine-D-alanine ligase
VQHGEDGVLQGALEAAAIPYVGCGIAASAVAMDKLLSRCVARSIGLEVANGVEGGPDDSRAEIDRVVRACAALGLPLFVKPACSGSSVGVTRVTDRAELGAAIATALREGGRVVVEEGIAGSEVSCPIVGDAGRDSRALPLIAIVPKGHDFFDYEAKYTSGHSDEICPAPVPESVARVVSSAAKAMHDALGCRGISRSDFIIRADQSVVFLEINTMPGMSQLSLVPKALAAAGIDFADQCVAWVDGALNGRPR